MKLRAVLLACAVVLLARGALADTPPCAWDVAKDPDARARWALHVRVERMLSLPRDEEDGPPDPRVDPELRLEAARAVLEEADAAHSPDVRLQFDLGGVYYQLGERQGGNLDLLRKAIDVLAPAIAAHPEEPSATEALEKLVYSYAKMNRPHEELATWRRYIPLLVDDRSRAVAMMNMGEAEMRLGHIDDALGTFREVMRLCGELPNTGGNGSTYVLSMWDLAVALDRSGDPGGALDAANTASRMTVIDSRGLPSTGGTLIASDPAVFFVPAWERQWYLALASAAEAREAKDARDAAERWAASERHWDAYIAKATADGGKDLFLRIARTRRDQVRGRVVAAQRAAARLPKRRHGVGWEGIEP